jgi:hypothetical protein
MKYRLETHTVEMIDKQKLIVQWLRLQFCNYFSPRK